MLALHADDAERPAQFVFDRGQLGGDAGLLAFVVSGARAWVERGIAATEAGALAQATPQLGRFLRAPLESCGRSSRSARPSPARPGSPARRWTSRRGLFACGDYLDGPYPATLEGAVRSGVAAARAATGRSGENSG